MYNVSSVGSSAKYFGQTGPVVCDYMCDEVCKHIVGQVAIIYNGYAYLESLCCGVWHGVMCTLHPDLSREKRNVPVHQC